MPPVQERALRHVLSLPHGDVSYWEYPAETGPEAPALLMVHGFRGDHHGLELLAAALPGFRVLAPDLPGFGESAPLRDRHDVAGYVRFTADFAAAAGLGPDTVLLGHTFGSIIAARLMAGSPEAFRALVLVNPISEPALKGPRAVASRLAEFYYLLAARLPAPAGLWLLRHPVIVRAMSEMMAKTKDPQLRRFIHDQHHRYFSAFAGRDVVLQAFQASISDDVGQVAARLAVPVLLIAGVKDDLGSVASQQRLAAMIPQARLEPIHDLGHLIHYEAPAEAAALVAGFVRELQA
ncbi:alpha/beta hydrolase [Arthrobacter deserti]|uniref:Alpha/beta hydrolase n=1 Tax=Arthrobacter deserti TaxID=1742687 RepID=A0ABX1JK72_9MICC|nr:alpha/beta hydrolase [Arthrobacter deserti]